MTLVSYIGALIAVSTLFGGAFWLADGLIADHVPANLQRPIGMLIGAAVVFAIVWFVYSMVVRHG